MQSKCIKDFIFGLMTDTDNDNERGEQEELR